MEHDTLYLSEREVDMVRESFTGRYALRNELVFLLHLSGLTGTEIEHLKISDVYDGHEVLRTINVRRSLQNHSEHIKGIVYDCISLENYTIETRSVCMKWIHELQSSFPNKNAEIFVPTLPLILSRKSQPTLHDKRGTTRQSRLFTIKRACYASIGRSISPGTLKRTLMMHLIEEGKSINEILDILRLSRRWEESKYGAWKLMIFLIGHYRDALVEANIHSSLVKSSTDKALGR